MYPHLFPLRLRVVRLTSKSTGGGWGLYSLQPETRNTKLALQANSFLVILF